MSDNERVRDRFAETDQEGYEGTPRRRGSEDVFREEDQDPFVQHEQELIRERIASGEGDDLNLDNLAHEPMRKTKGKTKGEKPAIFDSESDPADKYGNRVWIISLVIIMVLMNTSSIYQLFDQKRVKSNKFSKAINSMIEVVQP